jgi:hypothetical protein
MDPRATWFDYAMVSLPYTFAFADRVSPTRSTI